MSYIDLIVIFLYFLAVLAIAFWASKGRKDEAQDYFLAGRNAGWLAVGASLFASNIGSEHLLGLAGSGAASGFAVGHFEWLASLILLLLGWVFVPFYMRSGVVTMPEFLEQRYNRTCRWYFTGISILGYVLTKISVSLYAGGLIVQELTGIDLWVSAGVVVIFTGAYTMLGGLKAVLYTDLMQSVVLLFGSFCLVGFGLYHVGGWSELRAALPADYFSMWRPTSDPEFPWTGIILGAPILGIWYWCTDQYIVQRVLAAKSLDHAQTATIFAGFLKILPVFLFVLPGVIAAALMPELRLDNADKAFPALIMTVLPMGLKGVVLAAILAALMSSLSSVFNSCATLITYDLYMQLQPQARERTLVLVGRISTVVLVACGLAWIPFMSLISSQLYIYLQSIQAYIAPPIAACFLFGLFATRLNGAGAVASLATGFVLGILRLVMELVAGGTDLSGTVWGWLVGINFLHFSAGLFALCTLVLFAVSYLTPAPTVSDAWKKTMASNEATPVTHAPRLMKLNKTLSLLLAMTIFVLWYIFR